MLHQVTQAAADLDRATAFYAALLGQEPIARYDPPGLVFFDLDGTRLLLEAGAVEPSSTILYLRVDDVRAGSPSCGPTASRSSRTPTRSSRTRAARSARPAGPSGSPSSATARATWSA